MPPEVIEAPAPAPAPAPAAPAPAPAAPAPAPAEPSALAKPGPLHERIPEKFRVMKGEGGTEFDVEASTAKMLEAYGALEKRVGSGDLPPKAAEEYTITVPDALKDTFKEDEKTAQFRKDAHELGMNQKQFDGMMGKFFGLVPQLADEILQTKSDQVIASLDKAWGDKYDSELAGAMKTFDAFADEGDKGKFDDIMRDPALAYRILAKVSRELGEAGSVPRDASGAGGDTEDTIKQLTLSEAATNPKHPEHRATRQKLDAWYAKKYGTAPAS